MNAYASDNSDKLVTFSFGSLVKPVSQPND